MTWDGMSPMAPGDETIGLIPCGGHATRISPLPCSKELLPVGFRRLPDGTERLEVVSHPLLEKMRNGGVRKVFFILRRGKWDVPEYYGDGSDFGMDLGYLIMGKPYGPAYTLDQAYPFVRHARVAVGFPDILFSPEDGYQRALARMAETGADVVMGLYPVSDPSISDMIGTDRSGRVREMWLKPDETHLKMGWVFAVWSPRFTEFVHEYLADVSASMGDTPPPEMSVGALIQAGITANLHVHGIEFRNDGFLDIGTPEGLRRLSAGERPDPAGGGCF